MNWRKFRKSFHKFQKSFRKISEEWRLFWIFEYQGFKDQSNQFIVKELSWDTGDVPYDQLNNVLEILLKDVDHVYVKGVEKKQLSSSIIGHMGKTVIDLESFECPSLKNHGMQNSEYHKYPESGFFYHCAHANIIYLKRWMEDRKKIQHPSIGKSLEIFLSS
ncbi:hypothetical protein PV328_011717 [Microctonus aethiopoides]|uniref:Uncharacterized protein n=1 Tax=Microctonus aethiopoides TaxID=144406 RepID=A0AA39FHY5_9HYME|nr:hypothetical protein PV328_011717 [Microctonus aethiopoides]